MTAEWLRHHSPEFEAAPPKRNKVRPRKKIKRSGKCRRCISAKKKGKQQLIFDKSNKTYRFNFINTTELICSTKYKQEQPRAMVFDSDFHAIGVDNHASRTMSNNINHFISALVTEPDMIVKGAGGNLKVMGSGTLRWRIEDNDGKIHQIICKDAIYVPNLHTCLLSPQHWAQGLNGNLPRLDGTWCATYADRCVLEWDQRKNRRTIHFDRNSTNTPIIYSAPGNNQYRRKIAIMDVVAKTTQLCQPVARSLEIDEHYLQEEKNSDFLPNKVQQQDIQEDNEMTTISPASELLRWHHRLGHLSFLKMRILIKLGILPKKLLTVKAPMCASCKALQITKSQ